MEIQTLTHSEIPTMKIIYLLIMAGCFAFNTFILDVNWHYVAIAVGGSFSGSIILAQIKRENSVVEQCYKILGSSISGLIFGAMLAKWRNIVEVEYLLGTFFFTGMLSLFFVRSIVKITEQNSDGVTVTIFQTFIRRVFNVRTRNKKSQPKLENKREEKENGL